jgi:hypothetical protein
MYSPAAASCAVALWRGLWFSVRSTRRWKLWAASSARSRSGVGFSTTAFAVPSSALSPSLAAVGAGAGTEVVVAVATGVSLPATGTETPFPHATAATNSAAARARSSVWVEPGLGYERRVKRTAVLRARIALNATGDGKTVARAEPAARGARAAIGGRSCAGMTLKTPDQRPQLALRQLAFWQLTFG